MSLVQLIIPTEVAHDAVYELGDLGGAESNVSRRLGVHTAVLSGLSMVRPAWKL